MMRGAAISLAAERFFELLTSADDSETPEPWSRMRSHSCRSSLISGALPRVEPCTCVSTKPGINIHALAVDLEVRIARFAIRRLRPSRPSGLRTAVILLPSMTMSIGLAVDARSVDQGDAADHHLLVGPVPSPCLRAGAGVSRCGRPRGCAAGLRHRGLMLPPALQSRHQRGAENC